MSFRYANNISFISELEYELANAWLEMNLDNLVSNVLYLKALLPQTTKTMCVVKADAYGHGAVEVAHKLEKLAIDWFGVANIAEGKILRQSGIKLPILVLGNVFKEQIPVAINYDVTLTITSIESINNINEISKSLAKISNVYLKIDSGMSRVGIRAEKLTSALALIKEAKNLKLIGVFTHFAESENEDFTFTNKQLEVFQDCLNKIKAEGFNDLIIHSANSSAVLIHPESYFDMVRLGLAMYGVSDTKNKHLKPVMSLKSKLISLKQVPEGNSLGYGRTFYTKRKSLIGVIPVGYADGFSRVLSNKQDVLIRGKRCPIVGNISMDQCMVDLTDLEMVELEDEVVLLGEQGSEMITVEEWASKAYKITYEVLCGFGNRLPRAYVENLALDKKRNSL